MSESPTQPMITRYADAEPIYRKLGYAPIPVGPDKRPKGRGWTKLSPMADEIESRLRRHPDDNFGLVAGTEVPANPGYVHAFVDIDQDLVVPFVRAVLGNIITAKVGSKGETEFVRATRGLKSQKFQGPDGRPAVELMVSNAMVVIPDSMHPSGERYRWIGTPAPLADAKQFPILDETKVAIIEAVIGNPHAWEIMQGGAEIAAHSPMLSLTSSGIANLTDDLAWLAECLRALLPDGYAGNTGSEILGMLESAKAKGYGTNPGPPEYDPGTVGPVPIGFTREGLFVLLDRQRQILIPLSSSQLLSPQILIGLAPSSFWTTHYPSKKGGFSPGWAGEALITACRRKGNFDPTTVRGRGIWREGGRVVVNLGQPVLNARHLYLCFAPIAIEAERNVDAQRVLTLLRAFKWRNPQDAMLLLGWLALAPICGVLSWRPHCFVFGPARSGKTTLHSIASHLLHPLVIAADGQSTEAGIRQSLGPDSLPVIIDEFESDQDGSRLQRIIRLARSASSAESPVLRGTPEGKAMTFSLRATFFFAAINPRGMSQADQTRILMFELLMHDNDPDNAKLIAEEESYVRSLDSAWCSYMVSLAELIQPAIDMLDPVIPSADRRHRQNLGATLGAAFVALHGRIPTADEARALAEEYRPAVERHAEETERDDALECLEHLFSYVIDDIPLGQWLAAALAKTRGDNGTAVAAPRVVAVHDIVIRADGEEAGFLIRNQSPAIERVFERTRWSGGAYRLALRKLAGAFSPKHPVQFAGSGTKARAVGIPLSYLPELIPDWFTTDY